MNDSDSKPRCDCGRCNPRGPRGASRTPEQRAAIRAALTAAHAPQAATEEDENQ